MIRTALGGIDRFSQAYMPYLSIGCLVAGLLLGPGAAGLSAAVPALFAIISFNSGLGMRVRDLRTLRERPWVLAVQMATLHVAAPCLAWAVASLFYDAEAIMGFVILAMMPVSASSILWVGIFRGNITLAMAFILVDTLAAPFLIPPVLQLFSDASVQLEPLRMLGGLALMLFFPSLLALVCNRISNGAVQQKAGKAFSLMAKLSIFGILLINGGVTSRFFADMDWYLFSLVVMTFVLYGLLYAGNFVVGRLLFPAKEDAVAFMICMSMRSLTMGMVIATTYFSPLATFIIVLGMFFQQPMSAYAGKAAYRFLAAREG